MILEIEENLKKKHPTLMFHINSSEYDLYINERYTGISFRDGTLGRVEEILTILNLEIDFYLKKRIHYYERFELSRIEKINSDKEKKRETRNDSRRGRNSGKSKTGQDFQLRSESGVQHKLPGKNRKHNRQKDSSKRSR